MSSSIPITCAQSSENVCCHCKREKGMGPLHAHARLVQDIASDTAASIQPCQYLYSSVQHQQVLPAEAKVALSLPIR